jgi:decaprenylphospho-beta-D-ribofuranose 2-oxidase
VDHYEATEISGWGRYPRVRAHIVTPGSSAELSDLTTAPRIARGQGRSYGDAALLSNGLVIVTDKLGVIVSWDKTQKLLTAEAGTTLAEILELPQLRGWFPAVVPGTKYVSLGGAIAADIHGKNHHHLGSFGDHVTNLEMITAAGERVACSPTSRPDLFWATVGGMGLTGIIAQVTFEMFPVETDYLMVRYRRVRELNEALELCELPEHDDQYSVVWLDCMARARKLGRGVAITGHHATAGELPKGFQARRVKSHRPQRIPFDFPNWLLNRVTVGVFDDIYYWRQGGRKSPFVCDFDTFFFPLDRISNWNRLYGARGFIQYQCVLPLAQAKRGLEAIFTELLKQRRGSYLTVLKRFRPKGKGLLSFPIEGYTLTLDFPVEPELFPFLDRLDEIVLEYGGRVYLAKDARMRPEVFAAMYAQLGEWLRIKAQVDPNNIFQSDLSRRLGLHAR